jgi:hypothetical protein
MAKLTAAARNKLPASDFAGPGRSYPIEDRSHAQNALARVSQHGSPAVKAQVRAKVHKEYPSMGGTSSAGSGHTVEAHKVHSRKGY